MTSRAMSLPASSYSFTVPDNMSDQIDRLQAALADRYQIERPIGRGGMVRPSFMLTCGNPVTNSVLFARRINRD